MHHIDRETLVACFDALDGKKAVGADGVSKEEYGKDLDENVADLLKRMKSMTYRPGAIRRVLIPKDGKAGATRPLGIANFEDKLVQKAMARVLESIYEPIFRDCSYGFRPGRGCHDAIRLEATPMQVALAWLLHRAPNILLIPGTSSVGHLRENLAAARLKLTVDVLQELAKIGEVTP
jgi:hypothetical protein